MNISFENKRALVTGACQGMGKGIALRLSKFKATVYALSNNKENLDKLKKEHPEIHTVHVDLMDWEATRKAVESVLPIDLLVNNAGVILPASCLTASPREFDLTFGVNVKAMLNVSQVVAKDLVRRKAPGNIVNVTSQASKAAFADQVTYGSSKAAAEMLSRVMALELAQKKIRVNTVIPGIILTELGRVIWSDPKKAAEMQAKIPQGRFAEVDEVVDAVMFLLSDHSTHVTGSGIKIDGGFLST